MVKRKVNKHDLITPVEAAEILNLSVSRIYHLKHKLPHIKGGDSKQSRLLFIRDGLIDAYQHQRM